MNRPPLPAVADFGDDHPQGGTTEWTVYGKGIRQDAAQYRKFNRLS